jgi:hypothetical protein
MSEHEGESVDLDEAESNQDGGTELTPDETHVQPAADEESSGDEQETADES